MLNCHVEFVLMAQFMYFLMIQIMYRAGRGRLQSSIAFGAQPWRLGSEGFVVLRGKNGFLKLFYTTGEIIFFISHKWSKWQANICIPRSRQWTTNDLKATNSIYSYEKWIHKMYAYNMRTLSTIFQLHSPIQTNCSPSCILKNLLATACYSLTATSKQSAVLHLPADWRTAGFPTRLVKCAHNMATQSTAFF